MYNAYLFRLEAYQEAYLKEKATKVAHYQRALAEQVCMGMYVHYKNLYVLIL